MAIFGLKKSVKNEAQAKKLYEQAKAYSFVERVSNAQKVFELYKKAADFGYAPAQFEVGLTYTLGLGVPMDEQAAFEWYLKSAKQGYTDAQRNVGRRYHKGEGIQVDYDRARAWYQMAMDSGDISSLVWLGELYEQEGNLEKALTLYEEASAKGRKDGKDGYERVKKQLAWKEHQHTQKETSNNNEIEQEESLNYVKYRTICAYCGSILSDETVEDEIVEHDDIKKRLSDLSMDYNGKAICRELRKLRMQFAQANNLQYEEKECTNTGLCSGTCAYCEKKLYELNLLAEIAGIKKAMIYPATQVDQIFIQNSRPQILTGIPRPVDEKLVDVRKKSKRIWRK